MTNNLRSNFVQKLIQQLDDFSLLNHQEALEAKIKYFVKVALPIGKNKEIENGKFSIDLDKLYEAKLLKNKLNDLQKDKLLKTIQNSHFLNKSTIAIQSDNLSRTILTSIYQNGNSYGFDLSLYPVHFDKLSNTWSKTQDNLNSIVEFSSPNIAKPLHAGHMRSTFLGNFISNINQNYGHKVTRINYLGDWGTQYGLLAVGFNKFGSYEELKKTPMKHLLDVYVKANSDELLHKDALEHFARMEANDPELIKMWKIFKELSIDELKKTYDACFPKRLNIKFDAYESESQYFPFGKQIIELMFQKNMCKRLEDNRILVEFEDEQSAKIKYIVQKSDRSTLYITRDIAAILERKIKYNYDRITYVVDSSQAHHFQNLYKTVKKLNPSVIGELKFDEFYVPFGKMLNMSTRRGKIEFLSDLIQESKEVALESIAKTKIKKEIVDMEQTAQTIGLSHLIINDFLRPRIKDYNFTWSGMISNDTSAYSMHYAHARLFNLIKKANNEAGLTLDINEIDFSLLKSKHEHDLILFLAKFEEITWKSYMTCEPHYIVQYLFSLVRATNLCMRDSYVIGKDKHVAKARLLLYECSKQVISNCLNVIGIEPLNCV